MGTGGRFFWRKWTDVFGTFAWSICGGRLNNTKKSQAFLPLSLSFQQFLVHEINNLLSISHQTKTPHHTRCRRRRRRNHRVRRPHSKENKLSSKTPIRTTSLRYSSSRRKSVMSRRMLRSISSFWNLLHRYQQIGNASE